MHISYKCHLVIYFIFLCNNQCSVINAELSIDNKERRKKTKQIQDNQQNFVTDSVNNSK